MKLYRIEIMEATWLLEIEYLKNSSSTALHIARTFLLLLLLFDIHSKGMKN